MEFKYVVQIIFPENVCQIMTACYSIEEIQCNYMEEKLMEDLSSGCDGNSTCQINGFCECGCDFDNCIDFKILGKFPYIGKKDIDDNKIYADCSIVEFECYDENGTYFIKGMFGFCGVTLSYRFLQFDGTSDGMIDLIKHYDAKNPRIIDTIQENKLGLVKE